MQKLDKSYPDAWVIKLGGSLYSSKYLIDWLNAINNCSDKNIIIVPGGGPFADQIRLADDKFNLQSSYSHNMAVLAMQQFGYLLASLHPSLITANKQEKIEQAWGESKVVIWEPYEMVRDQCTLPKSWQVTSDSLAAWLAGILGIRSLLLIKSSKIVLETTEMIALEQAGCIDKGISNLLSNYQVNPHVMHKSKSKNLSKLLNSN